MVYINNVLYPDIYVRIEDQPTRSKRTLLCVGNYKCSDSYEKEGNWAIVARNQNGYDSIFCGISSRILEGR